MKKNTSIILSLLLGVAFSCSTQIATTNNSANNLNAIKTSVTNPRIVSGTVQFPESGFKIKAKVDEIAQETTVSIIYPSDYSDSLKANKIVATGLTDSSGIFSINPDSNFNPNTNEIFVLEATKRTGGVGNSLMTVRTNVQWNGSEWLSITGNGIYINSYTTALAIISGYNPTVITASDTISKLSFSTNGDIDVPLSVNGIPKDTIENVVKLVDSVLNDSRDPFSVIKFNSANSSYSIDQKANIQKLTQGNNCQGCSFMGVNLHDPSFSLAGKDLSYADLRGQNLSDKDLSGTILIGADLRGATLPTDLSYLNLSEVKLEGSDLKNGTSVKNLKGTNLSKADLTGCDLENGDFTKTRVTGVNFTKAKLKNTNFQKVNLFEANFKEALIEGTNFTQADLRAVDLSGIKDKNVTNVNFSKSNLIGANLSGLNLTNNNIAQAQLEGINLSGAYLESKDLKYYNLNDANFSGATLTGTNFANSKLTNADFSKAVMTNVKLHNSDLSSSDFTEADLNGSVIYYTKFDKSILYKTKFNVTEINDRGVFRSTFKYADMRYSVLPDILQLNLSYTNFSEDDPNNSFHPLANKTIYSIFMGANLTKVNFTGSEFNGTSNSDNPTFKDTILKNVIFDLTKKMDFVPFENTKVKQTNLFERKDLSTIQFKNLDLSGVDFSDKNLTRTYFGENVNVQGIIFNYNTNLMDAILSSNFSGMTFKDLDFFRSTLKGNFNNTTFDKVTFSGTKMSGSQFEYSTFKECTFGIDSSFKRVTFGTSNLKHSIFKDSTGLRLDRVSMFGTDLQYAKFIANSNNQEYSLIESVTSYTYKSDIYRNYDTFPDIGRGSPGGANLSNATVRKESSILSEGDFIAETTTQTVVCGPNSIGKCN